MSKNKGYNFLALFQGYNFMSHINLQELLGAGIAGRSCYKPSCHKYILAAQNSRRTCGFPAGTAAGFYIKGGWWWGVG
jgi:hypothetical protein